MRPNAQAANLYTHQCELNARTGQGQRISVNQSEDKIITCHLRAGVFDFEIGGRGHYHSHMRCSVERCMGQLQ